MPPPQLKPDEAIFVQIPSASSAASRILHAGRVVEADAEGGYLTQFDAHELELSSGQDVVLYYEWNRQFTQQPAHVTGVESDSDSLRLGISMAGDPVCAESRESFRVSAIAAELSVSLDKGPPCEVLDVSATGFSIFSREDFELGATLDALLYHEGHSIPGRVRVQNLRLTPSGRRRFGLQCIEDPYDNSLLLRALPRINLAIQREQLARRAGLTSAAPAARFVPGRRLLRS